ncbi:MAG: EVE domain-containing protein [SAR202 cluster bacterium]|nr:EVE domain-containing protein [SAR202 cluster bacterium]
MAGRRYWLVKSEPSAFSWADLLKSPHRTAEWDGVRNFQARNLLKNEMKVGDGVFFYHSSIPQPAIVGTAVVVREGYPDHTAWDPKSAHYDPKSTREKPVWYMVDIRAEAELPYPVTLETIKRTPGLEEMVLLHRSRLSVQPVTEAEWNIIVALGKKGA